jgi:hypothetical protein
MFYRDLRLEKLSKSICSSIVPYVLDISIPSTTQNMAKLENPPFKIG